MEKVKVNEKYDFEFEIHNGRIHYRGEEISVAYQSTGPNTAHVLHQNKSYRVELVEYLKAEKKLLIKVNSREYRIELTDRYDDLLHKLGLDKTASNRVTELKAPMPGLVLNVFVKESQQVSKGDTLVILEAMKMENIIKSPVDGLIKTIRIKNGDKLEKNQVVINFA